jgi:hypothetical protein
MGKTIVNVVLIVIVVALAASFLMLRYGGIQIQDNMTNKVIVGYDQDHRKFLINEYRELSLDGPDGPYVFLKGDSVSALYVEKSNEDLSVVLNAYPKTRPMICYVHNADSDSFEFTLHATDSIPPANYPLPAKLMTLSDIEGNFESLYSILIRQNVMDSAYQWTFGSNHLVLLGDIMDRGNNVIACLWLIYHLEQQAAQQGGYIHFILGNHEVMNFQTDMAYVHDRYIALAKRISGLEDQREAYADLLNKDNVLINWLKNKNCIERIGNILFVHGGIGPELLELKLSIDEINSIVRSSVQTGKVKDELAEFLLGKKGPLWYRGLVTHEDDSKKIVQQALSFYSAEYLVVGHTVVDNVSWGGQGKVIRVGVEHGTEKYSTHSQALLVDSGKFYRVDASGSKKPI